MVSTDNRPGPDTVNTAGPVGISMDGIFKCHSCGTVFEVRLFCMKCDQELDYSENPVCWDCNRSLWFNNHHTKCPACGRIGDSLRTGTPTTVREMRI